MDDLERVGVILLPLAHLLSISSKNETVDDEILKGWLVKEGSRQHKEGIKPVKVSR